jgi:hypothetical protein
VSNAWIVIERERDVPLLVGPYPGAQAATKAMDSLLIDGFVEIDAIDTYTVEQEPKFEVERVIPDLNDPQHTGPSS